MAIESHHRGDMNSCDAPPAFADAETPAAVLRIASLLNALQCGALLMARDSRIAHVNSRLCDMLQRHCHELVGTLAIDLYPTTAGRDVIQNVLDNFDSASQQEFHLPRPDGSELPVII